MPSDEITDRNTKAAGEILRNEDPDMASGEDTSGGDRLANEYQTKVVGEEAVGGENPTPDQDTSEYLAEATGIEAAPREPIQTVDKLEHRDDNRWELDPESDENYDTRRSELS